MRIAPVADVKARFSEYLKSSREGPIVITRNGKAVAVILSVDDEEELERLILAYSPKFRSLLDSARTQIAEGRGIAHKDFWHDVEADSH